MLDWYRVDVRARLTRVLTTAALLVLLGSLACGSGIVAARLEGVPIALGRRSATVEISPPATSSTPWLLGVLGIALVVAGAASAVLGLRRMLREERYLLLRSDGALFVRGRRRRLLKWRNVEEVVHEDGALVFRRHDGTALTIAEAWGGVSQEELARRAAQVRRRALFGLVR